MKRFRPFVPSLDRKVVVAEHIFRTAAVAFDDQVEKKQPGQLVYSLGSKDAVMASQIRALMD